MVPLMFIGRTPILAFKFDYRCGGLNNRMKDEPPPALGAGGFVRSAQLCQRGNTVVEADFLDDFAVDHLQDRGAGEVHLAGAF